MRRREIKVIVLMITLALSLASCNILSFVSQGESLEPPAAKFAAIDENAETPSTELIEGAISRFTHETATDISSSFAQIDYTTNLSLEEISAFLSERILALGAIPFEAQEEGLPTNLLWYYGGSYHNNSAPIHVFVEQDGELLHIYISLY